MNNLSKRTNFAIRRERLYEYFEKQVSFERLLPPCLKVLSSQGPKKLSEQAFFHLLLKHEKLPINIPWQSRVVNLIPGRKICIKQIKGPFKYFLHKIELLDAPRGQVELVEEIYYQIPLSCAFMRPFVQKLLSHALHYRHECLKSDLEILARYPTEPLKIALSGSSGFVGAALKTFLSSAGHAVFPLVRKKDTSGIFWDYSKGLIDSEALENLDAFIHLAGENIASSLWSKAKKRKIYESRVLGTEFLVKTLNTLKKPPKTLISASAIGYYGDDFLARLCAAWEEKALSYKKGRVAIARIGLVLSPQGGALAKMLKAFRWGLGAFIGTGEQQMSWISLDDLIYAFYAFLSEKSFQGPINCTSPNPLSNKEFSQSLARVLQRPCLFSIPAFLLRQTLGEMAEATLLASHKIKPKRLEREQFPFQHPQLEQALQHLLGL